MATFYEALRQNDRLFPLLRRPGINGTGVGYADPDKPARGAAIIVYTSKNAAITEISKSIGKMIGASIPVRFITAGPFKPHATAAPKKMKRHMKAPIKRIRPTLFRSRIRPIPGGTSIGRENSGTGTCGLIVIRNGQFFILSNNHVLIRANRFGANIIQPGAIDGGRAVTDRVGTPVQFVPFNLTGPNFMDAAIAQPFSNSLLNPRYLVSSTGQLIVPQGHLLSYSVGDRFFKSGRTTGLVFGTVESIGMQFNVGPYRELGNATLQFRNQTLITAPNNISLPGDSGSVWMSGRFAAALNFAGSGTRSISTPIASVLNTFGLRVAIPAGTGGFKAGRATGAAPKGNYAYVRPLSAEMLKQLRVVRATSPK
ncbi:S1 family peptidase [Paenibacillus andongensis]|uniref:S1 family peptidase n=1 Tax=Paenibacillus andongensis TaxID=2975482 RepID=UPI0021BA721B|nr:S1 family peptidase [Paenibacillus andongensis]